MDWSQLNEVTDWSDLSKMMEGGESTKAAGTSSGSEKTSTKQQETENWSQLNDATDWSHLSKVMDGEESTKATGTNSRSEQTSAKQLETEGAAGDADKAAQNRVSDLDSISVTGWADMKRFDDDHDPDYFEQEEKRLAVIYGGKFIKVKYTEQGRLGYFCELCLSEMNAKKSLEAHCEGMKHLKKKALWEKNNGGQKDNRGSDAGWTNGPTRDNFNRGQSPHGSSWESSRSPGFRGRSRGTYPPPKRSYPPRDQCVLPSGAMSRNATRPRDDFHWSRHDNPRNSRGEPSHHGSYRPRDQFDKRSHSSSDHYDRFDRRSPGGYNKRGRFDDGVPERSWERNDRNDGSHGSLGNQMRKESNFAPSGVPDTEKLSGGPTGLLLTKLASCFIRDEEDADLALNVVCSLVNSLRDYNSKMGEMRMTELLVETELKLSTLKALKVGLKLLNHRQMSRSFDFDPTPRL